MEVSSQVYQTYLKYIAPEDIHVYSINEVFMDVTAYLTNYKMTAHELAMKMIRDVLKQTGITATAGIGTNMYLCKVALPEIPYPTDTTIYRHREYLMLSERLINEAISEFRDKELAAQELRKFMRFQHIMDSYGDTETANDIKRHCDKWRDYASIIGRQRSKQNS